MLDLQRSAWRVMAPRIRIKVGIVLVLTFLISGMEVAGISLILPVLSLLVEPGLIQEKEWLKNIYEISGMESPLDFTKLLLFSMAGVIVLKNIIAVFMNRWQIAFFQDAAANISKDLFSTYIRMPFSETATRNSGFFVYVINSLGEIFYGTLIQQSLIVLSEAITIGLLSVALTIANPMATLLAVSALAIPGGIIHFLTASRLRQIGEVTRRINERTVQQIMETFASFKEIRVSGRGNHFRRAYFKNRDDLASAQVDQSRTVMVTRPLMEVIVALLIVAVAIFMLEADTVGTAIGQLSLFGVAALRIMPSISRIISASQTLKTIESPMKLYESELSEIPSWPLEEIVEFPSPPKGGDCDLVDISLRGVDFGYRHDSERVLRNVNLDIPFGTTLGISGPSGAGKTTLADMILGVLSPDQGEVLFNDSAFSNDPSHWRQKIAYVPQKISFVHGSLRENVAFGIDVEDIDDSRVIECLEQAQLISKLDELPNGLNSFIGEGGKFLSGGEKQRMGVARALYLNASVLILDEATSALDIETEDRLSQVIRNLKGSRSVVIIAHRLGTLKNCDRIAFMEDGKLDVGLSFNQLYKSNLRFKNMVDLSQIDPAHQLD